MSESKMVLSREEFREYFIKPLENKFGFKVYWNSKKLLDIGLKPTCYQGICTERDNEIFVILKYKKNNLKLLNTLIHECGHAYFHYGDCELSSCMEEVEAEYLARYVFEILNLNYTGYSYIRMYYNRCSDEELDIWENTRKYKIYAFAKEIAEILSPKVSLITKLHSKDSVKPVEDYKYKIECPLCGCTWKYKRMSSNIKNNAKGCYCRDCGEEKTLDKLIVGKI